MTVSGAKLLIVVLTASTDIDNSGYTMNAIHKYDLPSVSILQQERPKAPPQTQNGSEILGGKNKKVRGTNFNLVS